MHPTHWSISTQAKVASLIEGGASQKEAVVSICGEIKNFTAPHNLHAIDATPARWGGAGSSPRTEPAPHWLLSTQVTILKESRQVIFTGNGYGEEWPVEAAKRGLPNLKTTPEATAAFASEKNVAVFETMGVYAPDETHARAEVLYENYANTLSVEIETMVAMTKTGFIPACAKDLALYAAAPSLAGDKAALYASIKTACADLETTFAAKPAELAAEATWLPVRISIFRSRPTDRCHAGTSATSASPRWTRCGPPSTRPRPRWTRRSTRTRPTRLWCMATTSRRPLYMSSLCIAPLYHKYMS